MPKKLAPVHLTAEEREQLDTYVKQGKKSARSINRARILLLADEQYSDKDIGRSRCRGSCCPTRFAL